MGVQSVVVVQLPAVVLGDAHISTIRVNSMQLAWSRGRYGYQVGNEPNRPVLLYSAVNDGRTRMSHRRMSGFDFPSCPTV